jgi:competence protein ComEA
MNRFMFRPFMFRLALVAAMGLLAMAVHAQTVPAAVLELNRATRAELEALPGVGVDMATRILAARALRPFDDWTDLTRRVSGLKARRAAALAAHGVTVNGNVGPVASPASDRPRPSP